MRGILFFVIISLISFHAYSQDSLGKDIQYVCPPCSHVENILEAEPHSHDGQCPVCGKNLIERNPPVDNHSIRLHAGSGNFHFSRGRDSNSSILVFYHQPRNFNSQSKILLVIPGAGRNAWDYRDSWVEASEAYNVFILAPSYPEEDYDFAAYHLGGIVSGFELKNYATSESKGRVNKYILQDDNDLVLGTTTGPEEWIFQDFDRMFEMVVAAAGSDRNGYDIFGHSAGGQILHRMAMFHPKSKADRIVASNSGQYTLPSFEVDFPYGLGGSEVGINSVEDIFATNLILLIGENDTEKEAKGTMLHTPSLDKLGLGRLSRAKNFYELSRAQAEKSAADFNWKLRIVANTGHDYQAMGRAAAELLYNDAAATAKKPN